MTAIATDTPAEKLADELGQIVFRLETNFEVLKRNRWVVNSKTDDCNQNIASDIERLKVLKSKLQDLDMANHMEANNEENEETKG